MGRRPEVFRQEVIAALKILEDGNATRAEMRSSWAGAMGYTQFLPSDFEKNASISTATAARHVEHGS